MGMRFRLFSLHKSQQIPLLIPIQREPGIRQQSAGAQFRRMAAIKDRPDDVGSQEGQADQPGEGGSCHFFARSKTGLALEK
jgi:hypothetical protein